MATEREVAAMRQALRLATSPENPNGPNPRVGAVILDTRGDPLGESGHLGAGTPHAEVAALGDATSRHGRESVVGATAVVTLEPCNHHGRTGPCSVALVEAGIARVVYAQADTSPTALGGADYLLAHGVDVEGGLLCQEAEQVNEEFTFSLSNQRPFVTYKFGASLDGRVAAADGTSQWITGPAARKDGHRLRSEVDAVVVGTGTALADDPQLTARLEPSTWQPLRVVVGRRPLPSRAKVLDDSAPTLQLKTHEPRSVLAELYERDVSHVLVEGGPTLGAAFVRSGLVDRVVAYVAPALLGSGPAAIGDLGVSTIDATVRLHLQAVDLLAPDIRVTASTHSPGEGVF